jgi:hypothetical protein
MPGSRKEGKIPLDSHLETLVSKSGKLEDVLAPGMRKLYWKGLVSVTIDKAGRFQWTYAVQIPENRVAVRPPTHTPRLSRWI